MFLTNQFLPLRRVVFAAILASVAVAGCSKPPPATFDLNAVPAPRGVGGLVQSVVAEPTAVTLIDSERLVVRSAGNQVAYLPGVQWADRLPKLFQARLVQTFENAMKSGSVAAQGSRVSAINQINIDIRTFEVDTDSRQALVEVTVRIISDSSGRILASGQFRGSAPVAEIAGPAAAVALDQASQQVMTQIVRWAAGRS